MMETRDWKGEREIWIRVLERETGEGVDVWNRRIKRSRPSDERALREWLDGRGVRGYPRQLLVMETFGYPDFVLASADELIDSQYADRRDLRPIYDAIIEATRPFGDAAVQARKTFVSLVTLRRTFARVVPSTRSRVDLGLRLEGQKPTGRLKISAIHPTMPLQIGLTTLGEVDAEVVQWLKRAYSENS
jgi:Domain of unknown function (DUF5655)